MPSSTPDLKRRRISTQEFSDSEADRACTPAQSNIKEDGDPVADAANEHEKAEKPAVEVVHLDSSLDESVIFVSSSSQPNYDPPARPPAAPEPPENRGRQQFRT
ncbi:unnamed protein product, partial [Amoebophrya sp. A120]|eukprot:GSA120T00025006001.1